MAKDAKALLSIKVHLTFLPGLIPYEVAIVPITFEYRGVRQSRRGSQAPPAGVFHRSGSRGGLTARVGRPPECHPLLLHRTRSTVQVSRVNVKKMKFIIKIVMLFLCRYIALELCAATLQDYIENRYTGPFIDGVTILRHATAGLAHLHSLDIVHRDVKVAVISFESCLL